MGGLRLPKCLPLEGVFSPHDVLLAREHHFWLMVHNTEQLHWLFQGRCPKEAQVWIKVDAGIARLGFSASQLFTIIEQLKTKGFLNIVLCSHCACADDLNDLKTAHQSRELKALVHQYNLPISLSNSAGLLSWPETHGEWNRLGIAFYGDRSSGVNELTAPLKSVMTLQSNIIALRHVGTGSCVGYGEQWQASLKSQIATVAIGYADGYPRHEKAGRPR